MYQLRAPAPALARFIEHYWVVSGSDGPVNLRVEVFVDARADLIFNFGSPYLREVIGGRSHEYARSNLDAQRLVPIRIHQRGYAHIVGVRFKLGGLSPFVTTPLRPFTNLTPTPAAVLGEAADDLERALAHEADIDAQAALLDAFFYARAAKLTPSNERFAQALEVLVRADGNASVEEVAAQVGVSGRHVDRLFARYLGVAPKVLGRVLRFQRTLRALMHDQPGSLADIAAEAGYFDQPHFIKEFKRMTGGVPRGYRGYYPPQGPDHFAPNVVVFVQDGRRSPADSAADAP